MPDENMKIKTYWSDPEFAFIREIHRNDLASYLSVVIRHGGRKWWISTNLGDKLLIILEEMTDADALSMLVEGCSQASHIYIMPRIIGGPGNSNPDNIGDILDIEQFRSELIDEFGAEDGRVEEFTTLAEQLDANHSTIHERGIVVNSEPFVYTTEIPTLVDMLKGRTQSLCNRPILRYTHIQNGEGSTCERLQLSPVNGDFHFAVLLRMFVDGLTRKPCCFLKGSEEPNQGRGWGR